MTSGGRRERGSGEDELLSRLYQQLTEHQADRFGGGYDLAAGLGRYQAWLAGHIAEAQAGREASQPATITAMRSSASDGGPDSAPPHPGAVVTPGQTAWGVADTGGETPGSWAGRDAERAVTALYSLHYRSLVRLAAVLVPDVTLAEEIVQDSFVALHATWRRLADNDRALAYLRQAVVYRSRSVQRHRLAADKLAPRMAREISGAAREEITLLERSALVSALATLPLRQREVLVLRYYADLSQAQIASTLGISRGAVKSHTTRATSALLTALRTTMAQAIASDEQILASITNLLRLPSQ